MRNPSRSRFSIICIGLSSDSIKHQTLSTRVLFLTFHDTSYIPRSYSYLWYRKWNPHKGYNRSGKTHTITQSHTQMLRDFKKFWLYRIQQWPSYRRQWSQSNMEDGEKVKAFWNFHNIQTLGQAYSEQSFFDLARSHQRSIALAFKIKFVQFPF